MSLDGGLDPDGGMDPDGGAVTGEEPTERPVQFTGGCALSVSGSRTPGLAFVMVVLVLVGLFRRSRHSG